MKNLSLLVTILTTMLLCTACGGNEGKDNPLNITGMKIHWSYHDLSAYSRPSYYYVDYITIETPEGTLKYSDEDAELYYDEYALIFTWASVISYRSYDKTDNDDMEIKDYLDNNLLEIVCNLPLDDSYPENLREYVNRIYYNNVDDIMKLSLADRGYGYKKYIYTELYEYDLIESSRYKIGIEISRGDNDILQITKLKQRL